MHLKCFFAKSLDNEDHTASISRHSFVERNSVRARLKSCATNYRNGKREGNRSQLPISRKKDFSGEKIVVLSCVSSRRKIGEWIHKDSAFTSNGSHFRGHETEYTRGKLATGKVSPVTRSISARRFNFSRPRLLSLVHNPLCGLFTLCRARGSIHDPAIFRIEQHSVTMLRNELLRLELREGELSFNLAKQVEKLCVFFNSS